MNICLRYGLGLPLAVCVTIGLTISMAKMISAEFEAHEKGEVRDYAINPVVEDIVILDTLKEPKLLDTVEVPPASPVIEKMAATSVIVNPVIIEGKLTVFDPTTIDISTIAVIPGDTHEQPLIRVPPIMPSRATKSGYCDVRFDLGADGIPFNIEATYCTQALFSRPTIKSVAKWKYRPRIENGQNTTRIGITNRVSYRLTNGRGVTIPL